MKRVPEKYYRTQVRDCGKWREGTKSMSGGRWRGCCAVERSRLSWDSRLLPDHRFLRSRWLELFLGTKWHQHCSICERNRSPFQATLEISWTRQTNLHFDKKTFFSFPPRFAFKQVVDFFELDFLRCFAKKTRGNFPPRLTYATATALADVQWTDLPNYQLELWLYRAAL